jgi:hypothetical protein
MVVALCGGYSSGSCGGYILVGRRERGLIQGGKIGLLKVLKLLRTLLYMWLLMTELPALRLVLMLMLMLLLLLMMMMRSLV